MIDDQTYTQRVLTRASHRWYGDRVDKGDLINILEDMIRIGNRLDRVKKAIMYNREFQYDEGVPDPSVQQPIPTYDERDQRIIHAIMGIATEGVELLEAMRAFIKGGKPFDAVNLQEECGDVAWYRAFLLHELGQTHVENIAQNDAKLEKRFGAVFSEQAANERDLESERKTLEQGREDNDDV